MARKVKKSQKALPPTQEPEPALVPELSKITLSQDLISDHAQQMVTQNESTTDTGDLLIAKSANSWIEEAKAQQKPQMLFDELWFEGEVCILFADTNLGKSILAVQIANSISKGEAIKGFRLQAARQMILYFDFELSSKQFENRYSVDFQNHYHFDDRNFQRIELNPDVIMPEKPCFEELLTKCIERKIVQYKARVLIIDNLTYLKTENEKAANASPLMQKLKSLKNKYNLSMLVLAHTPKRDLSKAINENDLQGSKALMNFCDSSFAIGKSQRDKNIRYIKLIKTRQNVVIFEPETVAVCQISKPDNFLLFEWLDFGAEREHLKEATEKDREQKIADAIELKKKGLNNSQIARNMGVSETAVRKWLKKIAINQ